MAAVSPRRGRAGQGLPSDFAEAVLDVVARIPPARVLAYGDVAALLGRGGARAVGTVMARYGAGAPWWRVVRSDGRLPACHEREAATRHRAEGTALVEHEAGMPRVDMARARWVPPATHRELP
jgi:alkylated DNA nucleotide flippase Atl1